MQANPIKLFLSINEFREATTLGRTQIYKEIKEGRIRILKVGRRTLIPMEELQAWKQALAMETKVE